MTFAHACDEGFEVRLGRSAKRPLGQPSGDGEMVVITADVTVPARGVVFVRQIRLVSRAGMRTARCKTFGYAYIFCRVRTSKHGGT